MPQSIGGFAVKVVSSIDGFADQVASRIGTALIAPL
jgi:hypothetical protein